MDHPKMANKRRPRGNKVTKETQYMPAKAVAQKALSSVRKLGRRVGAPEIMYFDIDTVSSFTSSGATTSLSSIAQGDDVNTRDGNQITGKRLIFRGLLTINASANYSSLRLIIAADRECTGSNPAVSDVLATAEITGMYERKDNKSRFNILYDEVHTVNSTGSGQKFIKKLIPLKNMKIDYSGTSAADRRKNNLILLGISNEDTNYPQLFWNTRFEFTDV